MMVTSCFNFTISKEDLLIKALIRSQERSWELREDFKYLNYLVWLKAHNESFVHAQKLYRELLLMFRYTFTIQ